MLWEPENILIAEDHGGLDSAIEALPNQPAVFAVWPREGSPYLARTTLLRRRLLRLLRERQPGRSLNLRAVARRIEYRRTASWLETSLVFHEAARRYFPGQYLKVMKLRMPAYVKVILTHPFPRSQVTSRIGAGSSLCYGPFRTRISAEQFESQFLDLFQMRRCQEELSPSPSHPGCIYGEMNMCLRPCQQAVGVEEYRSEVNRVVEFLTTGGRSLLDGVAHLRDSLSAEMNFEEAARSHKRWEKIQQVLKLRDELVRDIDRLNGVAITPAVEPEAVELWFVRRGCWLSPRRFRLAAVDGRTVSMDQRLRETVATLEKPSIPTRERQEHLALLARWFYASGREGEWLPFDSSEDVPYRKLVSAISRVRRMA